MTTWDATSAECAVYTFKEGLLSRVAHDLRLRATRFSVRDEGDVVEVRVDATSIVYDAVMHDGAPAHEGLSPSDQRKVEATLRDDVLDTGRFAEIVFRATTVDRRETDVTLTGSLTLHGVTRPLTATARARGDRWEAEVTVHQPDFGIAPYRAMMGALKVKPDVRVVVRVPRDAK